MDNWFKRGRTSIFDKDRPGRPNEITTSEMIEKIHDIVINDRRVKVRKIAKTVGISIEQVQNILTTHLDMKKLFARWVPRLLIIDNKHTRVSTSKECLAMLKRNRNDFWRWFITVDETWIHYSIPETKEQSKQWVFQGETAPKKAKTTLSANKVMATVFWNVRGIIHVGYLEKGKTINREYYVNVSTML